MLANIAVFLVIFLVVVIFQLLSAFAFSTNGEDFGIVVCVLISAGFSAMATYILILKGLI